MLIDIKELKPCRKLVKVEVPFSEMEEDVARIKNSFRQKANVPGFRQGKVPMNIIEQQYGDMIRSEIIQQIVNASYQKVLEEKKLNPVRQPAVEKTDYKDGEKLNFQFELETAPVFSLPEYNNIPVNKKKVEVTDEHVESELKYLSERHASFEPVTGRGVQMGDFVVADYAIKQKDEVVDEAKQVWIEVREDFFIPKFCQGLTGVKKGEKKEIKVVLPKEYAKQELSGKKVSVTVTVNEIKKKTLPKVDDDFAAQMGKFKTLEELKKKIRDDLTAYFKKMGERDMVGQVEGYLLKHTDIEMPDSVVDSFHNALYEDTVANLKKSGRANDEFIKEKEKDIKETTRRDAVAQVKLIYILDAVAAKEKVEVSQDEINGRVEKVAGDSGKTGGEIRKYLDKDNKWWDFKYKLRNEKLINYLLEKAKITEIDADADVSGKDNSSGKKEK